MKERLTGAIILVALIVLLVPELLTGPVRSGSPQAAAATSSEEPPLRSYTIDLADDSRAHAATTSGAGSTTPEPSGPAQPAPVDPNAANTSSTTDATAGAPSTTGTNAQAGTAQAGTAQAGATTPRIGGTATSEAPATPVPAPPPRATPQGHSAPAVRTAAAVRPSPPARTASRESPATPSGGWMVQLGVFASRSNAERLATELKEKGFKISISESGGGSRTLFRVRAGPVADRTAASDLAAKLRAAGAPPGSVVPRT